MLIGKNHLEINQAAMCDIIQFFLDHQFAEGKSPKVSHVSAEGFRDAIQSFRVEILPPAQPGVPSDV